MQTLEQYEAEAARVFNIYKLKGDRIKTELKALNTKIEIENAIIKKINRYYTDKYEQAKKEALELLAINENFRSIELKAEWSKSRTWGFCLTATGWINGEYLGQAHASGCGYDKLSSKLSSVYNSLMYDNKLFKKAILLYCLKDPQAFRSLSGCHIRAGGFSCSFGGCGVESLTHILKALGFKEENIIILGGKNWDYFSAWR